MQIDPTLLSPVSALLGALIGGGASIVAAIYTQRTQNRLQRVASEVAKREAIYADFVTSASKSDSERIHARRHHPRRRAAAHNRTYQSDEIVCGG